MCETIWESSNMTKVQSHVILILPNVTNETIKCEKKIKISPNVRNVQSNVILVLPNVIVEPSNVKKINK